MGFAHWSYSSFRLSKNKKASFTIKAKGAFLFKK